MTKNINAEFGTLVDTGGPGEPVVFLHGFPNTPHMWMPVIEKLKHRYRCIAPTLPGFGDNQSVQPPDYSLAGREQFVNAVLQHLGIEQPVNLVVHDHGGPFGMHWAMENPEKVCRVALLDALWPPGYRWHFWARQWRTPLLGEVVMGLFDYPPGKWIGEWEMRRGSKGLSGEQAREAMSRLHPAFLRNAIALYRATDARTFDAAWSERWNQFASRKPVMAVWGDRDPYLPVRHAKEVGARRVEILEDCGHWVMTERPDQVAGLLLDFLA